MKILGALKARWVLTLVGVLLACLLIWFAGPYFAFADRKPLESGTARLLAILAVVVAWALTLQWRQWRGARASAQLAAGVAGRPAETAAAGAPEGPDNQLRMRFDEAMSALRKSRKGGGSLVDLPWYVIIGPPGAGKTTALVNSGLEFPLEGRIGKAAVRGVSGTRSCDWWFTSEAILLDTAGRYTTQDSDERADRAGWVEFLTLLKRHRKRRPINGVLLAMSVPDLAALSEFERTQHVRAIRRRLEELHELLAVRLPVYVLLTKADLIAGFTEYFDDLDQRGRAQVWGVTFPWEDSRRGRAHDLLELEFGKLVARVADGMAQRLHAERDPVRRAAIFGFPQQLASFRRPVTVFVREVFGDQALGERTWLRGVYITSGTQEGTPIDRIMGALARTFGLGLQGVSAAPGRGKAFFLERLLREVVFREAGLAGSDRKADLRAMALRGALYAVTGALAVGGLLALLISYRSNKSYLADVSTAALPLADIRSFGAEAGPGGAVPALDALRTVLDKSRQHAVDGVPLRMRFGLYQGSAVSAAAEDAYFRELNATLGPAAARQFAARVAASGDQPDRLYEYLKAYLMLGQPKHLDPEQMSLISRAEWERLFADDPDTGSRVATHFDALTAQPERVAPVTLDADLVEQARISLQQASLPALMYSRVRLAYAGDTARALQLDKELGLGAESVMLRKSGKPLGEPFPALYTRAVFDEFNSIGKLQLVKQFLEEGWVLGERAPALAQSPRVAADVASRYEQEYIAAWDELLADFALRSPRDATDAIDMLAVLSSPTSPLKRLLVLTEANTNLLKPAASDDPAAAATAKVGEATAQLGQVLGAGAGPKPGTNVTRHFEPLHQLVAGAPGSAPIDRLLMAMGQAQAQLQGVSGLGGQAGDPAALAAVQNALRGLEREAAALPPAVGAVVAGLSGQAQSVAMGAARSELSNRYQTEVVSQCRELVAGRYPFAAGSTTDVALDDFAQLFAPAGVYATFFQANLAPIVDTSRQRWRWREGAESVGGSSAMLAQMQAAERIRQVFFGAAGAGGPGFRFNVSPQYLDADVLRFRLEVDGQVLDYQHGPTRAVPMQWPGGTVGQASARFEVAAGGRPQLSYDGPWALFRLLDDADIERQSDTRFLVTFRGGGKTARVLIEASSIRNPIARRDELAGFRCG